jgi:dolichol-phosphate mannosyltransferase
MATVPVIQGMQPRDVEARAGTPTLVVVPTYDEVGNMPTLVKALERVVDITGGEVLVVDDGSPDGTGAIVSRLAVTRSWLHLVERDRPMGLGSAYRAGFRWALDRGFARVGEMDADLSHDPVVIPWLLERLDEGADLAVGSRYVPGGGSEGWPLSRRLLSKGANRFARTLLRLSTHDVTSGFRIYSRRALELLLEVGTHCDGYGFQVEGVYLVERAGGRVSEVPICFRDRLYGSSKMSPAVATEAARQCLRMALRPVQVPMFSPEPTIVMPERRRA